jgi:hypothetical protein
MSDLENINEAALTVRRTFYTILAYGAFCLIVLGLDFREFNAFGGKIAIPLLGTEMDRATFLIFGPLILIALIAYLHVFLGYWLQAPRELRQKSLPTLFSIDNQVAEIISLLIFYAVPPLILAHFALAGIVQYSSMEAEPQSLARWFPLMAFLLTLLALVMLFFQRVKHYMPVRKTSLVVVIFTCVAIFSIQLSVVPFDILGSSDQGIEVPHAAEPVAEAEPPAESEESAPEIEQPEPVVAEPDTETVAEAPPQETAAPGAAPAKPEKFAYAFYGVAAKGSWSERYFNNLAPGMAIGDKPRPGDRVEATGSVNARAGYIRYSLGKGWVNEKVLSVIEQQEIFTVVEVKQVVPNFYWIKVNLAERPARGE